MKNLLIISLLLISFSEINPQGIGELAPEKPPVFFPKNTWGADIMFGEGGFGLGTFYRRNLDNDFSLFGDFSISEAKDEQEVEYIDYYGRTIVFGKKNRILQMPLNFGVQQRLFSSLIYDNLRPYVGAGIGPSFIVTTPYELEFFSSFKKARGYFTLGGYIGFGANFGIDQDNLIGINVRYYVIRFFDQGVESLYGKYKKDLGGFYLTLNIGRMY